MSHDIWLTIDTGAEEPACVADVGNYTSNVSGMWAKALGERLKEFDGRSAGECLAALEAGVKAMRSSPEEYEAMNPGNGWGCYEGALKYLDDLRAACARHPKTTIRVSY